MPAPPIAIVGMACRYPGGARSPESLWKLLLDEVDAVGEISRERFDPDAYFHPVPGTPGRMSTRFGAFIAEHDRFDADFFGVSPREAERMDPQQRLLLEVAWELFEDAGLPPERASRRERTGVYVGMMEAAYEDLLFADPGGLEVLGLNGAGRYGHAGRLSYFFGLTGPSLSVDTACSSSLTSVHLAVQSLRTGECSLAVAGGAHLLLQPQVWVSLAQGNILAPDGRCKFGDESADGFGRGEGVGLVLLMRLDRALAEGRRVYAVIRGSSLGSYGQTDAAMARPSARAQEQNVRDAYADAGVDPALVGYVECHGTGTRAGDGTEIKALGAVLSAGRPPDRGCLVGSIKSNVAHLEGASGVAGLMKLALCLYHREVPRTLHVVTPNPKIPWAETPFRLARERSPWPAPAPGARRVGGINSFGMSGTNAHMVLEEAPPATAEAPAVIDGPALVTLSARDEAGLARVASALRGQGHEPGALARTLALGRAALPSRAAFVAADRAALEEGLAAVAEGRSAPGLSVGRGSPSKLAFVFSGHGSQWLGMGRQLYARSPAFRGSIEASDAAIRAIGGWSLVDELHASPERSRLAHNEVVQPVLFAMAVALAAEWRALGVRPDFVVGHSMGEIAAAHVAGALSLEDAARVAVERSALLLRVTGRGGMLLVELPAAELAPYLDEDVALAVHQSARASVLSGTRPALERVRVALDARGVFCRWVKVEYASHGPQMEPLEAELLARLSPVRPRPGVVPIQSTYLGRRIDGAECDARYWYENLRRPVRFAEAIAALSADGVGLFVEISPHPLLSASIPQGLAVPSLERDGDERRRMLESLGALWTAGWDGGFSGLYGESARGLLELPHYPFAKQRHWFGKSAATPARQGLLGARTSSSLDPAVTLFTGALGPTEAPYLADHAVDGARVLPGVAYAELALEASAGASVELRELRFESPLVFEGGASRLVQLALVDEGGGRARFAVSSEQPGGWQRHASGRLEPAALAGEDRLDLAAIRARLPRHEDGEAAYARLAGRGLEYGPAFRGIVELWRGEGEALARVELPPVVFVERGVALHPALLDACLQAVLFTSERGAGGPLVPVRLARLAVHGPLPRAVYAHARADGSRTSLTVVDAEGRARISIEGLELAELEPRLPRALFFRTERAPAPPREPIAGAGRWLVVGGPAEPLAAALRAAGDEVLAVEAGQGVEAYGRAIAEAFPPGARALGVVHLGRLEAASADMLSTRWELGPTSALHLAQALLRAERRDNPRLWLVAREGVAADAPIFGFGRVLATEHPELSATRVHLAAPLEALAPVLRSEGPGDELVLGPSALELLRLAPGRPAGVGRPTRLRGDRSYLVTGGLGGLGRELARDLAVRGARHLVLVGRRGGAVEPIEGASVRVAAVDVADRAALEALLRSIEPPLAGVFHAAGVIDDGLLAEQSSARFRAVFEPKALGAWNLHRLAPELELFVLYSSAAATLGTAGQSGYAAANAFLDALAAERVSRGLPALSIAWGAFSEVGLAAASAERGERLALRGMGSLTPAEGHRAIAELLEDPPATVGVMRFDARQWLEFHPQLAASSYFMGLVAGAEDAAREEVARGQRLRALPEAERVRELMGFVRDEAARVLRLDAAKIDANAPLRGAGFDSLMGLELRNRLERGLGLRLAATLLWVHPTVRALAEHLSSALVPAEGPAPEAPAQAAPPPAVEAPLEARLAEMSEREKEALLEATLRELE